ncbi:unnamed protein product, partial [Sphagnum compactum]
MQKEEGMVESQLEHIQRIIAKQATKVLQDRAKLQLQQQTLEETQKAMQEVKVNLTTQLKVKKQMVEDASLVAQATT